MNNINSDKTPIIDVCRNNYIKCVKSDVPCSEGYGVNNLVSSNFVEKSKGFLAERFIKPPVTLTFEFICSIQIKYIAVLCKVGAQKTTGVELFTLTDADNDQYTSVASGVLQDTKSGFVFHRFGINVSDKFGDQYYFRTFKPSRDLNSVVSIKLKLFRTSGTVPALGRLEVWGIPSKALGSLNNCNSVRSLGPKLIVQGPNSKHSQSNLKSHISSTSNSQGSGVLSISKNENTAIPEDFIDPISYEVMTQPVILPSGKIVDNKTLESYEKAEKCWGRGPSDPFTGIAFTDGHKPIAASALKVRIDKYLSDNSNNSELLNIPRTVGRNCFSLPTHEKERATISKLISNSSTDVEKDQSSIIYFDEKASSLKRRKVETIYPGLSTGDRSNSNHSLLEIPNPSSETSKNIGCTTDKLNRPKSKKSIFENSMDLSLDCALKTTLSKLPKLSKSTITDVQNTVMCNICKFSSNLFHIPCNHFVCRRCLVSLKPNESFKCTVCKCTYKSGDVQKIHLV